VFCSGHDAKRTKDFKTTNEMKPKILFRIASAIIVLHAIGHLFGMAGWTNAQTEEQKMVVHAMTDHRFPFMGAVHSFGDSFNGFGYIAEISLLLAAYLLWICGSAVDSYPVISKKMSAALFIALFAQSLLEFIYFFPLAATMTLIAAVITGAAFLSTKST
jgi:hypothetical protein